jgi:hypothetical protein
VLGFDGHCRAPEALVVRGTMLLAKQQDPARRFGGLPADLSDTSQEELEPTLPVACLADRLEPVVVRLSMSLEIVREIQHRLVQRSSLAHEKRDQEPAHAAVAIEERMDHLELSVREPILRRSGMLSPSCKNVSRSERARRRRRRRHERGSASEEPAGPIQF